MTRLENKVALVVGVANTHSIATGCAQAFADAGAEIALSQLNEKAKPFVKPVAEAVGAALLLPLDVETDGRWRPFCRNRRALGRLDIIVHSIAFCPANDLHVRVTDCSSAGFARAMDIWVHSLIRMPRLAEPLMTQGGTVLNPASSRRWTRRRCARWQIGARSRVG